MDQQALWLCLSSVKVTRSLLCPVPYHGFWVSKPDPRVCTAGVLQAELSPQHSLLIIFLMHVKAYDVEERCGKNHSFIFTEDLTKENCIQLPSCSVNIYCLLLSIILLCFLVVFLGEKTPISRYMWITLPLVECRFWFGSSGSSAWESGLLSTCCCCSPAEELYG